ncbi:MAG: FKBP-type peptidyl-prolyl cis-trans isomerase [Simkania sp.]|nr:FKBP-type peptidyl-prolyl cis-trans isomerase [Simkania sp.]
MSLKNLAYFFCGVIVTGITFIAWNYIDRSHVSISEEALGGMFYEELAKYPAECDVDKITLVMRDISYGKRKKMSRQDREEILFELASRESEEIARQNLLLAEAYLKSISNRPEIMSVIDEKVYIEILQQGSGEKVSQEDCVSIKFVQYDIDGKVIRDTQEQAIMIPLSRMIKGFKVGLEGTNVGERRKIYIHPDCGFSKIGRSDYPNQLLIYEVQVVSIHSQPSD